MDPLLEQFLMEARDNLEFLDENLQKLESEDDELINSLFRAAHTLKGGAGLVGLDAIKEVTHAAEDLLDAYRQNKVEYDEKMVDVLYDAFDEVIEMIDAIEERGDKNIEIDEEKITEIKNEIRSFLNQEDEAEDIKEEKSVEINLTHEQLKRVLPYLGKAYLVDIHLNEDAIMLGNDPFYLLSLFGENLIAVTCEVGEITDIYKFNTRIKAVINTELDEILDVFYNVEDEIDYCKLTLNSLLYTELPESNNDTYKTLIEDIQNNGDYLSKLKAAINVINPDTKEGFIVDRLYNIAMIDENILKKAFETLNIKTGTNKSEDTDTQTEVSNEIDEKEKESLLNILKSQKLALVDESALERVKFVLRKCAKYSSVSKDEINEADMEKTKEIIDLMIKELSGEETSKEDKHEKIEEKQTKQQQKSEKNEEKKTSSKLARHKSAIPRVVKIEEHQIDELMDIVGEILVIKNSLPYIADTIEAPSTKRELINKYEEISRIVDQLQDKIMSMRLLPLSYIFNRYPKLVRDLSKKLHKKIDYQEYGADTKLDKTVIEKLADPLVHVIRNSLDHGLETPEERIAKGKSEVGKLIIGARSEGDRVFIEISDDGRGIDINKVINKALEKRLIDPEKIDKMSEEEKLSLIFLPGLSTKDEITDLSGRGVGADAVKSVVSELGGSIKVTSQKDKGTKILIELPLSVALTNLFQVKMANENYAIAMENVIETDKIEKSEIKTANHQPFIKLRDNIIPVLLIESLIKRKDFKDEENLLIIKVEDKQVALVVDEFIGQVDVVQKPLTSALKNHPFINGVSLLGNGEPLFVIKPKNLIKVL